uniref:RCAN family member 3 n=1 Tax=Molossus molossus TaxID=27622 RepID=A0A7J8FB27_MOLMO|nr:RCAN family member 3 [Molossus molossus]
MLRDTMKSWNDTQTDLCSSDQEEEEEMIFGENEDDLEEMMDLSDLPTSLFACSVHEAVFEVQEQKVRVNKKEKRKKEKENTTWMKTNFYPGIQQQTIRICSLAPGTALKDLCE